MFIIGTYVAIFVLDAESDSLHSKYSFELDEDIFSKVKNAAMYKYDSKARSEESGNYFFFFFWYFNYL